MSKQGQTGFNLMFFKKGLWVPDDVKAPAMFASPITPPTVTGSASQSRGSSPTS